MENLENRRYQINPHLNETKMFKVSEAKPAVNPLVDKIKAASQPTSLTVNQVHNMGQQFLASKPTIGSMNIRRIAANYDSK